MEILKKTALVLTIIGALNWGLIGLFNLNLVTLLISSKMIYNLVYIIIGICSLISITALID